MALTKRTEYKGMVFTYMKIISVTFDLVRGKTLARVALYRDKKVSVENVKNFINSHVYELPGVEGFDLRKIYILIKKLPEFQSSEDS